MRPAKPLESHVLCSLLLLLLLAVLPAAGAQSGGQEPAHDHRRAPPDHEHALAHEGPVEHSFADAEAWAERFESADRDEWQMPERVVAALGLAPGMRVADIGSGTGYFARRFATAVGPSGTVWAADVEPGMAVYVRRRADEDGQRNLVPVLASYDDPRLPAGGVDLVFICNTWHHISDRVEYARRLASALVPGGRVAIVDFLPGELPVGPRPEHKLSAEEVTAELVEAGYTPADSPDFLPYQYLLIFEAPERAPSGLRILLAHDSEAERRARAQLERLLAEHDLEPLIFTRTVLVDESQAIPHSHPILTLNAQSLEDDDAQLATLVHEQLHWLVLRDQQRLGAAIAALRELYPEVPTDRTAARDEASTYLHLVICDLELQAMTELVGEERARQVLAGWNHYRWIYDQVLENPAVRRVNESLGLVVP